jgi:DNA-binding NtrC family response regulator
MVMEGSMALTSRLHILLVEDDDTARRSIASVLERAGYIVDAVPDGEQAVALLNSSASGPAFDVVLTDLLLGTLDGVAVLKAARAMPNPPEVILLTGYGTLQTAIEALRAGAFDYLLKPCRLDDLLRCIKGAAERRAARAEQTAH